MLHSVKRVVDANSAAEVMADALNGREDFLLEPDDAAAAEAIAYRLNANQEGDGGHKLLACFTRGEDNVFLAMQANGSVSLLTKDGIVGASRPSSRHACST